MTNRKVMIANIDARAIFNDNREPSMGNLIVGSGNSWII